MVKKEFNGGIHLIERENDILFTNGRVILEFSKDKGKWQRFSVDDYEVINYRSAPVIPADFKVDGEWKAKEEACRYLGFSATEAEGGGVSLGIDIAVGEYPFTTAIYINLVPQDIVESVPEIIEKKKAGGRPEYVMTCVFTLLPGETEIRRRIKLQRNQELNFTKRSTLKFESYLFKLPGVILGSEEDCVADMPGPITMTGLLKPRIPYAEIKKRYEYQRPAPDFGYGITVLSNTKEEVCLSQWMETMKTTYGMHFAGNGDSLSFLINEEYPDYIYDKCRFTSSDNIIRFSKEPLHKALQHYSSYLLSAAPPLDSVPGWVKDAVIMEVDAHYCGGFQGIKEKLPLWKETGFNLLYLLPINTGSYYVFDHYAIDPKLGTPEDLKEMVAEAHRLGIRVLIDLLVSVMTRDSRMVREHPECFIRDECGRFLPHVRWENVDTDYANPNWSDYLVEFATYCVREYGIDGYRVDAASSKSPNWYPHSGHAPWETMMGSYAILGRINRSIKQINPDAILLDEVGGPAAYRATDIGHNIGFMYKIVNTEFQSVDYTIKDYKKLLCDIQDIFQEGVRRVFYVRNHDTAWFYRFDGYNDQFFCYEAVHCLIRGIPSIFAGQFNVDTDKFPTGFKCSGNWGGPDEKAFSLYRKLFALRREHRIFIEGSCHYREIDAADNHVFSAVRRWNGETVLVLINECGKEITTEIMVDCAALGLEDGRADLDDLLDDVQVKVDSLGKFKLSIKPYGTYAFKLMKCAI